MDEERMYICEAPGAYGSHLRMNLLSIPGLWRLHHVMSPICIILPDATEYKWFIIWFWHPLYFWHFDTEFEYDLDCGCTYYLT
jgi:hypothetical protein